MAGGRKDPEAGSHIEVFLAFFRLGLTSFGGPIAHLGYFRRELVQKRGWVTESGYAQLLAICQFLPGPASSQLGFSLGMLRAGWAGALAAFVGFTLPSAVLLFSFAMLLHRITGGVGDAAIHGLKLVALAVVAHAVMGMARRLCFDIPRATIGTLAAVAVLLLGQAWVQILVVGVGALAGSLFCSEADSGVEESLPLRYGPRTGWMLISAFAVLLLGLPILLAGAAGLPAAFLGFYRAGSLVFGGGHVVLPLLEETVVGSGWISGDDFLAGYGAAQAIPGPLFSFSAFLGALLPGSTGGVPGAAVSLVGLFLPGFLLVAGVLPLWRRVMERPGAGRAVAGASAAVVGLLGAALYDPVWTGAVEGAVDVAIGLAAFTMLVAWRAPAILVVLFCVLASLAAAL